MQYLMGKERRGGSRRGFTLVELLVVIVVLAVLAAIVLPKFINSSTRSKESAIKGDLKLMRNAISLFNTDTGYYPASIADLAATTAPAKGLDATGTQQNIAATDWHGPYIDAAPAYPFAGGAWVYSTASGTVGAVTAPAPYASW